LATFSHPAPLTLRSTGEGDMLEVTDSVFDDYCLLPFAEWEKVAEGQMRVF
jgi:hypothetical protein